MPEENANTEPSKARILQTFGRGVTPASLASIYGISLADVKEITSSALADASYARADPEYLVNEHLYRLDAAIEELASVAPREKGAVRVRAIDTRLRAQRHRFEVMQGTGIVPPDVGAWSVSLDAASWCQELVDILDEHGVLTEAVERSILNHLGHQEEREAITGE